MPVERSVMDCTVYGWDALLPPLLLVNAEPDLKDGQCLKERREKLAKGAIASEARNGVGRIITLQGH